MIDLFWSESGLCFYKQIRNSNEPFFVDRRIRISAMWKRFEKFADKEFVSRFPYDLSQRYWEMLIGCTLLDCGLLLCEDWARRKDGEGLDFKIDGVGGQVLWVEATTCGQGDSSNPNAVRGLNGRSSYLGGEQMRQIKLRVANAFSAKIEHIRRAVKNRKASSSDFFIIAIGGGTVDQIIWHNELSNYDSIISLFLPINETRLINLTSGPIFELEQKMKKIGTSKSVDKPFQMPGSELISGVLFSTGSIMSKSYKWDDEIVFIENFRSSRKISADIISKLNKKIIVKTFI